MKKKHADLNAIIRYFSNQWKVGQIKAISKNESDLLSIQFSLLPTLSKLYEKDLLRRIKSLCYQTISSALWISMEQFNKSSEVLTLYM